MRYLRNVLRSAPVILGLLLLGGAPSAMAQQIPTGCNGSGISISIFAFFADGVTPAVGVDASECETLVFKAALGYAPVPAGNCAFEQGALIITTPDGVEHDVTPPGGIFDPLNPGQPLQPGSGTIDSLPVTYVVNPADIVGGQVVASTSYNQSPNFPKGISFTGTPPSVGINNGGSSIGVDVVPCPSTFCAPQVCDPNATDPNVPGRQGLCVAGQAPVCTLPPGVDPNCFVPFCDTTTDMCSSMAIIPVPPICQVNPCGNFGAIRLAAPPGARQAAASTALDRVHVSMRPLSAPPIDPTGQPVTLQMSNDQGVFFTASLPPGALTLKGRYYTYRNKAARTEGGIAKITIWERRGQNQIYVDAFGDLSGSKSHMTSTVIVGDTQYNHDGTWKSVPKGWLLPINGQLVK